MKLSSQNVREFMDILKGLSSKGDAGCDSIIIKNGKIALLTNGLLFAYELDVSKYINVNEFPMFALHKFDRISNVIEGFIEDGKPFFIEQANPIQYVIYDKCSQQYITHMDYDEAEGLFEKAQPTYDYSDANTFARFTLDKPMIKKICSNAKYGTFGYSAMAYFVPDKEKVFWRMGDNVGTVNSMLFQSHFNKAALEDQEGIGVAHVSFAFLDSPLVGDTLNITLHKSNKRDDVLIMRVETNRIIPFTISHIIQIRPLQDTDKTEEIIALAESNKFIVKEDEIEDTNDF